MAYSLPTSDISELDDEAIILSVIAMDQDDDEGTSLQHHLMPSALCMVEESLQRYVKSTVHWICV